MHKFVSFFAGVSLLLVGAAKVWTHTQSLQAFLSVRCGPEGLSLAANTPTFWSNMFAGHCWGCPVALAGLALIFLAAAAQLKPITRQFLRVR